MIKILCPTDFSAHAKKALEYAVHLTNLLDAELHIINAYKIHSGAASMIKMDETIKHNRILELNTLVSGISSLFVNDIPPVIIAQKGIASDVISNYAEHNNIDLVVMGTQGISNMKKLLLGSVTRKTAKKLPTPTLAIPMDAKFDSLKGKPLLLALDSKQVKNEDALKIAGILAQHLNTNIDILHVAKDKDDMLVDPFAIKQLEPYPGEVIIRESNDPIRTINEYLNNNPIGILIMIRRQKTFFERIFLKGFTDEELSLTSVPLLILPEA